MQNKERRLKRRIRTAILALCVISGLALNSCLKYDSSTYPVKDVLIPNEEVQKCPLGWIVDGKVVNDAGEEIFIEAGVIINEAFSQWIVELRKEIKRLRKLVK